MIAKVIESRGHGRNLGQRGLDPERPILAVIDGGKAIRSALRATIGKRVLIARCRAHKRRNVLDHLPEDQRTFISRKLDKAWQLPDAAQAEQELRALAAQLQSDHPGAAASLRVAPARSGATVAAPYGWATILFAT